VVLVEGNFDVLSSHQSGYQNVVATCGTSLTEEHLMILRRQTKKIILAFDADKAGKLATLRSVELVLKTGLDPYIIDTETLGKDIDEALKTDPDAAKRALQNPYNALEYLMEKFTKKLLNGSIEGQKRLMDTTFNLLRHVSRPVERAHYLGLLAGHIGTTQALIEQEFQQYLLRNIIPTQKPNTRKVTQNKDVITREQEFVGFVSAYLPQLQMFLDDETVELLTEDMPKKIMQKYKNSEKLTEEETAQRNIYEVQFLNLGHENLDTRQMERLWELYTEALKIEQKKRTA